MATSEEIDTSVPAPAIAEAGTSVPSVGVGSPDVARAPTKLSWKKLASTAWPLALAAAIVLWTSIPLCPTKFAFGIPCPGCGLTRATLAMLRLDLHGMLHFHPLAPIVTPLVVWWIAAAALGSAGLESAKKWDPGKIIPRPIWILLGVALIGLFALRAAGLLGGLPDRFDPASSAVGRVVIAVGAILSR